MKNDVVQCFRRMGYTVAELTAAGDDKTNILISKQGINCLVEITEASNPHSQNIHSDWQGLRAIVNSKETALQLANRLAEIKLITDKCGLDEFLTGKRTLDLREC